MIQNNLEWHETTKKKSSVSDRPTNRQMDRVGLRVACTRLKKVCYFIIPYDEKFLVELRPLSNAAIKSKIVHVLNFLK